jgi:cation:H+ antiporter
MSAYLLLFLGLAGLFVGGDLLVRGSVRVAQALGLSPLVIGLTLVGFGTSTPELLTSLQAAFSGLPGIAVGNVVGSNIGNILLILGLAAMIAPIGVARTTLLRDGGVMLASTLLCVAVLAAGSMGRFAGIGFVALLIVYLVTVLRLERKAHSDASGETLRATSVPWSAIGVAVAGLAVTLVGARFAVTGAVEVANALGISETVIGLTVVAVGTSLPELVTSVVAVWKRQGDIAFGNIVGSNIFNILGILGITAAVHPLAIPEQIANFDGWVMLAVAVALLAFSATGKRLSRVEGALLLAAYALYVAVLLKGVA